MGSAREGGLRKLGEELEAENAGMRVSAEITWLGKAKVRARLQEVFGGCYTPHTALSRIITRHSHSERRFMTAILAKPSAIEITSGKAID